MRIDNTGKVHLDKVRSFESSLYASLFMTVMFFCLFNMIINDLYAGILLWKDAFWKLAVSGGLMIFSIELDVAAYDKWKSKIEVCEDGIWRKLPRRALEFISWDEFQEVCVCYDRWGSRDSGRQYYVVICFVKHGVRKDGNNRWYIGIFNYRKIISMDYTYELHDELKEKCPLGVLDLRDTPEYAIK